MCTAMTTSLNRGVLASISLSASTPCFATCSREAAAGENIDFLLAAGVAWLMRIDSIGKRWDMNNSMQ